MLAGLALITASCNKEVIPVETPAEETVVFTASLDDTKTVLKPGNKSEWISGDKITVFNEGKNGFTFSTNHSGSSVAFQYTGSDFKESNKYMAVYPSGKNVDFENKTVAAVIPTDQPSRPDTYTPKAAVAVAYTENDTNLSFKNATALIKFTVKGTNIKQVVFFGNNNENVSGDVTITLNADNTIKSVAGSKSYAELWADTDNHYFAEGPTYYLAVVPQVYTKGFTVQVKCGDAEADKHDILKVENEYNLKSNTILNIGQLTYGESAPTWAIAGAFNSWNAQAMAYQDGLYVMTNVTKLHHQDNPGFKFFKNGSEWHGTGANDGKMQTGAWEYLWGGDNNGSNIYVEGATADDKFDIYLNPDKGNHGRFVIVPAGTAVPKDSEASSSNPTNQPSTSSGCKLTIKMNKNDIDWYNNNIYAWISETEKLAGDWPGTALNWVGYEGDFKVYYYVFPADLNGKTINYIVNCGNDSAKTKDLSVTLNGAETVVTLNSSDKN